MTSDRLRDAVASLDAYRNSTTVETPDLFSVIEAVAEHAGDVWRAEALRALEHLAQTRARFTVEHLSPLCSATYDRRALGAILLEGKRRRWIVQAGYVSGGRERHGRPVVEWRSLLHPGGGAA